eukprot:296707-Pleurochrysis_carterae.AAC.1
MFRWPDFGTDLQEFVSVRLRQTPGDVRLDSERYMTELASEFFPGGVHANYAVPARPKLPSMVDDAVRRKSDANNMTLDRQTRYRRVVAGMQYIAMTT